MKVLVIALALVLPEKKATEGDGIDQETGERDEEMPDL